MLRVFKYGLGAAALLGVAIAIAAHGLLTGWLVRKTTLEHHIAFLEPHVEISVPASDTTDLLPVVIQLAGCGGLRQTDGTPKPHPITYRDIALDEGFAVVIIDSWTPRGYGLQEALSWVCSGYTLRGAERAGDLFATLQIISRDPRLDPSRIGLAGWSHGGWTIMDAFSFDMTQARPHNLLDGDSEMFDGIQAMFLSYPYCGFPARTASHGWTRSPPVTAILVESDTVTPEKDCIVAFDRLKANGSDVSVTTFSGVTHAFDESDLVPGETRFEYAPAAAVEAHKLYRSFLSMVRDAD